MRLCETCKYRDKTEYFKPCIIYRDDCEYYEKERDDMTDDLISRQAVHYYIEAHINEIITESGVDKNEHTNRMLRTLLNGIDTMPSVTPTERIGHWIPVIERLPKDEDYVLVCYADGSIRTAYYYIDTESYPPEFRDFCETGWYDYNEDFIYQDVLAWMSLPEPYEPQESEDNV